jgi:hypothetical protein
MSRSAIQQILLDFRYDLEYQGYGRLGLRGRCVPLKFKVNIGRKFPVNRVEEEKRRYLEELTRSRIAIPLVWASILALLGAAALTAYDRDFSPLLATWGVVGPILGLIIGHYFQGARKGDNEDHTSTA